MTTTMTKDQIKDLCKQITGAQEVALGPPAGKPLPVEEIQGITDLLDQLGDVRRHLSVMRANMAADLHYLGGASMRDVAHQLGFSVNAISLWLKQYGPQRYVTVCDGGTVMVGDDGASPFFIELVTPRRGLLDWAGFSRRVAPARLGLFNNDLGLREGIDPEQLWTSLASQAAPLPVVEV